MRIAEAFVELRVDSRKAKAEAEKESREVGQSMTRSLARAFSAAVVVNEFNNIKNAASELEQAVGGTTAIFGEAEETINRFAENSAEAVGLSEAAFRTLTSQIGGLLNGLGFTQRESAKTSVELAQLGADLAATFGGTPEQAVEALGAALRGEFNPLERFGVSLRVSQINLKAVEMGLAETKNEVDDHARSQAALALITEQSAQAQGQFGREADTAAGKEARLQAAIEDHRAEIGENLLPVYGAALDLIGGVLGVFGELPSEVQTATVALAGIAIVAGPIKDATAALGGLSGALRSMNPRAVAAAGAIGAGFIAYRALTAESRELEQRTNEVSSALINASSRMTEYATEAAKTESTVDDLKVAQRALADAFLEGEVGEEFGLALGALGLQLEDAHEIIVSVARDSKAGLTDLAGMAGVFGTEADVLVEVVRNLNSTSLPVLEEHLFGAALQMGFSRDEAKSLAGELAPVAVELQKVDEAIENMDAEKVARDFLNAAVASSEHSAALVEQAEANLNLERSGDGVLELFVEYGRLLAAADQTTRDAIDGQAEYASATEDVARAQEEHIEATKRVIRQKELDKQFTDEVNTAIDTQVAILEEAKAAQEAYRSAVERVFDSARSSVSQFSEEALNDINLWQEELRANAEAAASWETNLVTIAERTSVDFALYLADMGVESATLVQAMIDDGDEMGESFGLWKEHVAGGTGDVVDYLAWLQGETEGYGTATGEGYAENLGSGIDGKSGEATGAANNVVDRIKEAGDGLFGSGESDGKQYSEGMASGINLGAPSAAAAARAAASGAVSAARGILAIASPSKVTRDQVGKPIVEGIAEGITENARLAERAMEDAAGDVVNRAKDALAIASPSEVMADEVGEPIVDGIALGIRRRANEVADALREMMAEAEEEAVRAAEDLVRAAEQALSDAFGGIRSRFTTSGARDRLSEAESGVADAQRLAASRPALEQQLVGAMRERGEAARELSAAQALLDRLSKGDDPAATARARADLRTAETAHARALAREEALTDQLDEARRAERSLPELREDLRKANRDLLEQLGRTGELSAGEARTLGRAGGLTSAEIADITSALAAGDRAARELASAELARATVTAGEQGIIDAIEQVRRDLAAGRTTASSIRNLSAAMSGDEVLWILAQAIEQINRDKEAAA